MNKLNAQDNMIKRQIREGFVTDEPLLEIISTVPREFFVPEQYKDLSFVDMQIPIGHVQVMLRPQEEALILQALKIKATENILEIGTGTGYFTALLAKLGRHVTSVDIFEDFTIAAKNKLQQQAIHNTHLLTQDILSQWFNNTSFDVIVITGALLQVPKQFLQTLTLGGRLFAMLGESSSLMTAMIFNHQAKHFWSRQSLFETRVPFLVGSSKKEKFSF